jgi:hypothetical protein
VGDSLQLPCRGWLNTLHCTVARHVRPLFRSSAMGEACSQRPKFENNIHNSPVGRVEHKCLEAGLHRMPDVRQGARLARNLKWHGQGPYMACLFFRVKLYKPLVGQRCLVCHPNLESTPPPTYIFRVLAPAGCVRQSRCSVEKLKKDALYGKW